MKAALSRTIYRAAAATASAGCRRDPCAASIARIRSGGRNGFCRQTTSESSGVSDRKSSAVIPEIATTGRPGTRARSVAIRSEPLVPCRKISTIARSKLACLEQLQCGLRRCLPRRFRNDGCAARWKSSYGRRPGRQQQARGASKPPGSVVQQPTMKIRGFRRFRGHYSAGR